MNIEMCRNPVIGKHSLGRCDTYTADRGMKDFKTLLPEFVADVG